MGERIAVITGASRGLGLATAMALAAKGFFPIVTARTRTAVDEGLAHFNPGTADGHVLDVSEDASVEAFHDWLHSTHGHAAVLVNNAGRAYWSSGGNGIEIPASAVAEAINNNALSAYRMIQRALPHMNRVGWGRIVNVSSGMGQLSEMGGGDVGYRISKTAMNAITRVAAAEAGPNVKVNSVCPGWVRTDMGGQHATRTLEQGASGIVWAATLPDTGPGGGFFRDGKAIDW
jgi:NAD(P)-dependent dehydrogenase (short-subunit alcohol dehydrogenase family)